MKLKYTYPTHYEIVDALERDPEGVSTPILDRVCVEMLSKNPLKVWQLRLAISDHPHEN